MPLGCYFWWGNYFVINTKLQKTKNIEPDLQHCQTLIFVMQLPWIYSWVFILVISWSIILLWEIIDEDFILAYLHSHKFMKRYILAYLHSHEFMKR